MHERLRRARTERTPCVSITTDARAVPEEGARPIRAPAGAARRSHQSLLDNHDALR